MNEAKSPPKGTVQLREWTCSWLFSLPSLLLLQGVYGLPPCPTAKLRLATHLLCYNSFQPLPRKTKNRELLGDYDSYLVPKTKGADSKSAPFRIHER